MKAAFAVTGALASSPVAASGAPALSRAESGSGSRANPYVIVLWGPTGAGKSWLGNSLSAYGGCGGAEPFKESESIHSCTKTPSSALRPIEVPRCSGGTESLWFEFVDLMGNADTDGESTESVDQAVLAMKSCKPHLICLVENANTRHNAVAVHSLKAMKMCVEGCWGEQNIMQVVNQVKPPKRNRGSGGRGVEQKDPQQLRQEMMKQRRDALEEMLGLTVTMQIVVPQIEDPDDPQLVQPLQAILKMASKVVNRVTVEGMQTFTEKQLFAAERVAEDAKGRLLQQISKQEQDVAWYRQASAAGVGGAVVGVAIGLVLVPFTFGVSLVIGVAAAAAAASAGLYFRSCAKACEKKLAILNAELLDTQTNLAGDTCI